jgi:multicomponent Na+:H+ antiporter subunit G
MSAVGTILLATGAVVLLLASIGLFRLRDALSRQHAATKAGSLGIAGIVLGAGLIAGDAEWIIRALLIAVIVWATLPVASHALARAALRERDAAACSGDAGGEKDVAPRAPTRG